MGLFPAMGENAKIVNSIVIIMNVRKMYSTLPNCYGVTRKSEKSLKMHTLQGLRKRGKNNAVYDERLYKICFACFRIACACACCCWACLVKPGFSCIALVMKTASAKQGKREKLFSCMACKLSALFSMILKSA